MDMKQNHLPIPTWHEEYIQSYAASTRRSHIADLVLIVQSIAWTTNAVELSRKKARDQATQWSHDLTLWRGLNHDTCISIGQYLYNRGYAYNTVVGVANTVDIFINIGAKNGILKRSVWTTNTPGSSIISAYEAQNTQDVVVKHRRRRSEYINIDENTAEKIKKSYDLLTPISRQKALIVHLGLELGFRTQQMVDLQREDINLEQRLVCVRSPRTKEYHHRVLSDEAFLVLKRYLDHDAPSSGQILRRGLHTGDLGGLISTRGVNDLVRRIGEEHELNGLAPDDLYHYWQTHRKGGGSERL